MSAHWALALAISLFLAATPLAARDLTDAETTGLTTRIASFEQAMVAGDPKALASVIPPRVIAAMAAETQLTEEALVIAMEQALARTVRSLTIESYAFDLNAAKTGETSAGRAYVLIPTSAKMRMGDQPTVQVRRQTLAFEDAAAWYLMRIDEVDDTGILIKAYPEFEGISFAPGGAAPTKE